MGDPNPARGAPILDRGISPCPDARAGTACGEPTRDSVIGCRDPSFGAGADGTAAGPTSRPAADETGRRDSDRARTGRATGAYASIPSVMAAPIGSVGRSCSPWLASTADALMAAPISADLRAKVRRAAANRCGYCLTSQAYVP